MEIHIIHNNMDWLIIVDDYDYQPEEPEVQPTFFSDGEQGFPESIDLTAYHLELETGVVSEQLTDQVNDQLLESNALCEHLLALHSELIHDIAIELHTAEFSQP